MEIEKDLHICRSIIGLSNFQKCWDNDGQVLDCGFPFYIYNFGFITFIYYKSFINQIYNSISMLSKFLNQSYKKLSNI